MHILGLANGTVRGNSEILLKAALKAASDTDKTITTSWIHVPSAVCPPNPKPLQGVQDVSLGSNTGMTDGASISAQERDDRAVVLNALLDADALIFTTPVYSHSPMGVLKGFLDKILGPYTDVAFARRALERKEAGDPAFVNTQIDQRLLKPRIVGFLAVAGSTTPDQISLALPMLHLLVYSLHAKVVDQDVLLGYGAPGIVAVKNEGVAVKRAEQLGRNVASQLGKPFDEAQYLGPEVHGACPNCHLAKFELLDLVGNISCVTCGTDGKLEVDQKGSFIPVWNKDSRWCCITMIGKIAHLDDIIQNGRPEGEFIKTNANFAQSRDRWLNVEIPKIKLSSDIQNGV